MKSLLGRIAFFCAFLSVSGANAATFGPGEYLFIEFDTSVAPYTGTARVNATPDATCPLTDICSIEVFFSTGRTISASNLTGTIGFGASSPVTDSVDLSAYVATKGDRSVSVSAFTTVFADAGPFDLPATISLHQGALPPGLVSTIPIPATIPLFVSALALLFIGGWRRKSAPKPSELIPLIRATGPELRAS